MFDDFKPAILCDRPIALRSTAVMSPVADHAGLSTLSLLGEVFQVKRPNQTLNADVDFLRLAVLAPRQ